MNMNKNRNDHSGEILPENADSDQLITMLGKFFRYLLELDEYTLGLICQVVAPTDGKESTVKTLSRIRGCSRQAIHRKILSIIGEKPELSGFFAPLMKRISSARQNFILHRQKSGTV